MKEAVARALFVGLVGAAWPAAQATLEVVPQPPVQRRAAPAPAERSEPPGALRERVQPRARAAAPEPIDPRCSEALSALSLGFDLENAKRRLKELRCE